MPSFRSSFTVFALLVALPTASQAARPNDFGTETLIASGFNAPYEVRVADLDGDGDEDIVSLAFGDEKVAWFENLGGWSFAAEQLIESVPSPQALEIADLDADGDLDLVVGGNFVVRTLENLGGGQFAPSVVLASDLILIRSVVAADLDGDGDLDVAASSNAQDQIVWFEGDGTGAFGPKLLVSNALDAPRTLCAADLDGDGLLDLACGAGAANPVSWLRGNGAGFDDPLPIGGLTALAYDLVAADLNGDGALDLAAITEDNVHRFLNDPAGWVEDTVGGTLNSGRHLVAADLSGNGSPDLALVSRFDSKVAWFANQCGEAFAPEAPVGTTGDPTRITAGDLDGDGDLDLVVGGLISDQIVAFENLVPAAVDCNGNGIGDDCEIGAAPWLDWDGNGVLDGCAGEPVLCTANPNSVSSTGARLMPLGSPVLADDDFALGGFLLPPGMPGYFICSRSTALVNPFGGGAGVLCLGPPVRRMSPQNGFPLQTVLASGYISPFVDVDALPFLTPVVPGDTIHFQFWFREPNGQGGMTSNTSDAVSVLFR